MTINQLLKNYFSLLVSNKARRAHSKPRYFNWKTISTRSTFCTIFTIITVQASFCFAQNIAITQNKNLTTTIPARLDNVVEAFQKYRHFMGTVMVVKDDQILLKKAYGMANLEWQVPNTSHGKFRLGSITKQFTATAILQLAEQHKLSVDDTACSYFDRCPKAWKKITIRQLLSHTSGIPSYTEEERFTQPIGIRIPEEPAEILLRTKNKPLDFKPGTQWHYDNSGYIFLGIIIEKVSGEKYADYIKKYIFEPLGMSDSGYEPTATILDYRVSGYHRCGHVFCNANYMDMSIPFAAGALYSTVEDMYKWDRALYTDKILSNALRRQMFMVVMNNYGYGWDLSPMVHHQQIGHGGNIFGFSAYIARFPKEKVLVIVLSNVEETDSKAIAASLAGTIFGEQVAIPTEIKPIFLAPTLLKYYTGIYKVKSLVITVTAKDGHLEITPIGQPGTEAVPFSKNQFFIESLSAVLTFTLDKETNTMELKIDQGGSVISGKRINK